jgi:hypothetical protein
VVIPASVTSIWANPIDRCDELTSIVADSASSVFSSGADGVLFNKDKTTLVLYPHGKAGNYVIPNGVTRINGFAFLNCTSLTGITIPESVTAIDESAFNGCSNLTGIYFKGNVPKLGKDAFANINTKATVYHLPDATGWGPDFVGHPTAEWKPAAK